MPSVELLNTHETRAGTDDFAVEEARSLDFEIKTAATA